MKNVYIGIDVSKSAVEADMLDGTTRSFGCDKAGMRRLSRELRRLGGEAAIAVYEPTGGYERTLELELERSGILACMASAWRVRQFARSQGVAAKTDALDARAITRFAQASNLKPKPASDKALRLVRELLRRRGVLLEMVKAEDCRASRQGAGLCRRQSGRLLAELRRQIGQLESEIRRALLADPGLSEKSRRLESVKGIGWLTAATALAELPELGHVSGRQAASLAGLAPFARDSGKSFGKRFVSGGNARVRAALYMPAQRARIHNAHLRAFYKRLRDRGKPFKVAITAVMRKMVVLMNRILSNPDFQPT